MAKARAKLGEKRLRNQPLLIDRLPSYVHDAIVKLRAEGRTYQEIEEESRTFVKWEELAPLLVDKFPGEKLPKSNINRWYDLRVEQVRKETLAEAEQARVFAEKFAAAGLEGTDEAVINAMRDEVFRLTQSADPKSRQTFQKMLGQLSLVMTRIQRVKLQARKVDADIARSEAERAKFAAEAGDPREIYLFATQDVLKKLRTRAALRAIIDPIKDELIQELAHGAAAFAKQIEASTSR